MITAKLTVVCFLFVVACDETTPQATDHLRSLGYASVACASPIRGSATCTADGQRFRCVVASADGCGTNTSVACERFFIEKPAP